ncbi:multidrug efflux SMR transporter [Nocardiopsis sp. CNT312]|uniref:DMT family transporter n=1 Tax=Nocardiopsis sp. CNT312 TaxID=1137268 RepID=UPI000491F6DD|nr:multidrug efflux SMR transporter [Nocardiopsis sp. CNT312]
MPWFVLLASAVFEAAWATALGMSDGFSRPGPTAVFLVTLTISMLGLGWSAKHITIGTAYAVWVGVGAALTVACAMATGAESASPVKVVFIAGIVAAVIGLKLVPESPRTGPRRSPEKGRAPGGAPTHSPESDRR